MNVYSFANNCNQNAVTTADGNIFKTTEINTPFYCQVNMQVFTTKRVKKVSAFYSKYFREISKNWTHKLDNKKYNVCFMYLKGM